MILLCIVFGIALVESFLYKHSVVSLLTKSVICSALCFSAKACCSFATGLPSKLSVVEWTKQVENIRFTNRTGLKREGESR